MKLILLMLFISSTTFAEDVVVVVNHGNKIELDTEKVDYILFSLNKPRKKAKFDITYKLQLEEGEKYCAKSFTQSLSIIPSVCNEVRRSNRGNLKHPYSQDIFGRCYTRSNRCHKYKTAKKAGEVELSKSMTIKFSKRIREEFIEAEQFKIYFNKSKGCFRVYPLSANTKDHRFKNNCQKTYIK